MSAGLDLSAVERVILSWAIDELEIHRDNGVSDDELDPETLQLIPTEGELVWSGLGALQPLAGFGDDGDPDVVQIIEQTGARYRALLPLRDITGARVGDVVTARALHSPSADPRLQGRAFSVVHLGYPSSFAVASIVYLRPVLDPTAPTTPPDTAPDPEPDVDPPVVEPDPAPIDPPIVDGESGMWVGQGEPESLEAGEVYLDESTGDVYQGQEVP